MQRRRSTALGHRVSAQGGCQTGEGMTPLAYVLIAMALLDIVLLYALWVALT